MDNDKGLRMRYRFVTAARQSAELDPKSPAFWRTAATQFKLRPGSTEMFSVPVK
jgi:hypothetical protein